MPNVTYVDHAGAAQTIDVPVGENVMRGAVYNGLDGLVGECGGALSCATCHVFVDAAWTAKVGGPASEVEGELLACTAVPARDCSRLGCQIVMSAELDGLVVQLPGRQY